MNKERILILAKLLEKAARKEAKPKVGFNMMSFNGCGASDKSGHGCGTTACIGGWAIHAFSDDVAGAEFDQHEAARILGMAYSDAHRLFFPNCDGYDAGPARAARVLRHLAKTGTVDWSIQ